MAICKNPFEKKLPLTRLGNFHRNHKLDLWVETIVAWCHKTIIKIFCLKKYSSKFFRANIEAFDRNRDYNFEITICSFFTWKLEFPNNTDDKGWFFVAWDWKIFSSLAKKGHSGHLRPVNLNTSMEVTCQGFLSIFPENQFEIIFNFWPYTPTYNSTYLQRENV